MIGAIIGDIVGSVYEFTPQNIKTKDFPLFSEEGSYTDDSILSVATAEWLLNGGLSGEYYAKYGAKYPFPMGGYGNMFVQWINKAINTGEFVPYNSCGNGSAMRVSPAGWYCNTEADLLAKAKESAECSHNHPEGIKGAQATALCIMLARQGKSTDEILQTIETRFGYDISMSIDELRPRYSWFGMDGKGNGGICQDSVPQAIMCALQATDFEDAIRNAISIGGDSDTIGCICGGIAEALFGVPYNLYEKAMTYLPEELKTTIVEFEEKYGNNIIK